MSEQDELIAKVRKLSEAATAGPWATPNYPDVVESGAGHRVAEASAGNYVDDAKFIAESRTLLPALADLAESEGRRADEAEAERSKSDGAYEALFKRSSNSINTMRTERDAALAELAALKGQQP